MSEYFPEPKLKVELDLSNYATKTDFKNAKEIDTLSFAKNIDLAKLKSNVDKLDIDKLKNVPTNLKKLKSEVDKSDFDKLLPVPVDLSKLSDFVKNDVVKKDEYNAKIKNIEDKIPSITNLATEVKGEIPISTNLATKTGLNVLKIKYLALVIQSKKNDYNTNINEIEKKITDHNYDKYITNPEFDKLISENSAARLKQVKVATKSDIANFVNNTDFDDKLKYLNKKNMHFQMCTC